MLKKSIFVLVASSFITFLVLSLPGCGGGNGGASNPATNFNPQPYPSPVPASNPVAASAVGASYYVDPVAGSDAASGTQAAPFKTLTWAIKAASVVAAASGVNINAASGVYSAASGETFPLKPTFGEYLIGTGIADVEGSGNYTITGGQRAVAISTTFAFAPGVSASLTGFTASGVAATVVVADGANITLSGNSLRFATNGTNIPVWVVNGSTATITSNTITGGVTIDSADAATKVIARGNTLYGTVYTAHYTATASQLDLGTAASPGNNIIKNVSSGVAGVTSLGAASDVGVTAVGNTWLSNVQGADASGHYAASNVAGPTSAGPNYYIVPASGIQF